MSMSLENEHAIITDDEEIKKLFPSPLLPFGALELSSQTRNTNKLGTGQKYKGRNNAEIQAAEGGVRSRVPAVCTNMNGALLLPDSKEYLSKLERMICQSRANSTTKQLKSEIEMDSIVPPVPQSTSEDDERVPFIKLVCDVSCM